MDGSFYPDSVSDTEEVKDVILEKLAPQMSSAVEWTSQVESMKDAGARIYLEVGPKRALALFAEQILDEEECIVNITNHPKAGGITSFFGALGMLAVAGRCPEIHLLSSEIHTAEFSAGPIESFQQVDPVRHSLEEESLRVRSRPLPNASVSKFIKNSESNVSHSSSMEMETEFQANRRISTSIAEIFSKHVGFPSSVLIGAVSLSEIGLTSQARSSIVNAVSYTHLTLPTKRIV